MSVFLSDTARRLLDQATYVTAATVNPDGSPQATVVWAKRDGDDVLVSTSSTTRKATNLQRDPRVAVAFWDPEDPFVSVEIRGTATVTEEGGRELIQELSAKYTGNPYPVDTPGTVRVVVRITPQRVIG